VTTAPAAELPADALVRHMVGHELAAPAARERTREGGDVRLDLQRFSVLDPSRGRPPRVRDVSFSVDRGEIVGLAGLQGSGKSDLLLGLFGAHGRRATGAVRIDGRPYRPTSVRRAIRRGLGLVTNDRQRTGLLPAMSVVANVSLASLPRVSPGGLLRPTRERARAEVLTRSLRLGAASPGQVVSTLSGGNQQKVVLAKWMGTEPRVLLLDEPTRGVDVGAKQEIYQQMDGWRRNGLAVVLTTSELPELLRVSDRILVMHRGGLAAEYGRDEATAEKVLRAAMGGD
jgi:ABC-type sugar transport system ATPase subunit